MHLGRCDGSLVPKDLISEIAKWLSFNRGVYANVYYTNVNDEGFFGSYACIDQTVTNYRDLSPYGVDMFVAVISGNPEILHYCINQSQCNYYAQQTNLALDVIEGQIISNNRNIISYSLYNHIWIANYNEFTEIGHRMNVYSGISHNIPPAQ